MSMPEVQKPHWKAPSSRNAFWMGASLPFDFQPFGGHYLRSLAWTASTEQAFTAMPSTMTVHAPQETVSQPLLVPVSPMWSLMASTRRVFGFM